MDESVQLQSFVEALDRYEPTIPEEVVGYYLSKTGFPSTTTASTLSSKLAVRKIEEQANARTVRLVSLATHKFLSDITNDAMQYQRMRNNLSSNDGTQSSAASGTKAGRNASSNNSASGGGKTTLQMQDLASSLRDYGVHLQKPEYYCDSTTTTDTTTTSSNK